MTETTPDVAVKVQLPESLESLKRAARARAEAARRAAEEKAAAEAEEARRRLLDAVAADLPAELLPYVAPVDGAAAHSAVAGSRACVAALVLPGHRLVEARYLLCGDRWERAEFGRDGPADYATVPAGVQPQSLWRVCFVKEELNRCYHDLGAALAAAETDDASEWADAPAPAPEEDLPF